MKNLIAYSLMLSIAAIFAGSCRKKEAGTIGDKVLGRWKLAKTGSDDNNNGYVEGIEIKPVATAQDYEYQFNGDGTGTRYSSFDGSKLPDESLVWQVRNDSLWIAGKYNDTTMYHILTANASELIITKRPDQAQFGFEWYYYTRK